MGNLKLCIFGSRGIEESRALDWITVTVPEYFAGTLEIVSGGARGVDSAAEDYAQEHGWPFREFLPDYEHALNPKYAPLERNQRMSEYADVGLCFWDGYSRGTLHMISCMAKLGKRVFVVGCKKEYLE